MFKKIFQSDFYRNVLTLVSGTTLAQAIPVLVTPILTRIFSPDDFALLGIFISLASIIGVIVTGRYELAILLPKGDKEAITVTWLSAALTFVFSAVLLIVVLFFNDSIAIFLGSPVLSNWLYLLPLSVFLIGVYQSMYYWFNRTRKYKKLSVSKIVQSTGLGVGQVSLGFFGVVPEGLIIGRIFGQLAATMFLLFSFVRTNKTNAQNLNKTDTIKTVKRYQKFPQYLIVGHTLNALSLHIPIIILTRIFDQFIVGFYTLTYRIISIPISIIAMSVGDVFKQEASKLYLENKECKDLFNRTLKHLFTLSFVPFIIFFFISPWLFKIVFGQEWVIAGEYAQILTIMFFLQFLTKPLINMFIIAEKQVIDLFWQIIFFTVTILALTLGYIYFRDIKIVLLIFASSRSLVYLAGLVLSRQIAYGKL